MTAKKYGFSLMPMMALLAILFFVFPGCAATAQSRDYEVQELCAVNGEMEIYGKMYLPAGERENLPVVILSHSAGLNCDSMNSYCIGFAERGFAAYAFDFCGGSSNSRSDGSEEDMTIFTEVEDLKAVIGQIKSLDYINSEKVYLFGTSQGGLVSALAANDCGSEIAGLMLLYPAFNIPEMAQNSGSIGYWVRQFQSINWTDMMNNVDWSKMDWRGFSFQFPKVTNGEAFLSTLKDFDVYEKIGAFQGNVLILHGTNDVIVNESYSERAQEVYENCELHIMQGAMHGFNQENKAFADYDQEVWEYIDAYLAAENG